MCVCSLAWHEILQVCEASLTTVFSQRRGASDNAMVHEKPQRGRASLHCSVRTTDAPGSVMIGERQAPNNGGLVLCSKRQRQRATAAGFLSSGAALRRAQRRASITTGAHKLARICTGRRRKTKETRRALTTMSRTHTCSAL